MGPPREEKRDLETRPGYHLAAMMLVLCGFALAYVILEFDSFQSFASNGSAGGSGIRSKRNDCGNICSTRLSHRLEHFDGRDLLNRADLKKQLEDAKKNLIRRLKGDYGEYFDKLFVNPEDGSYIPIVPYGDQSLPRLKAKLMIKVLSAQKGLKSLEANVNGCYCASDDTDSNRRMESGSFDSQSDAALIEDSYGKFVWSTGGHSAAAAHGNLYNESYTAYMEQDLKEIFGSVGIEFEGRNYAMGGTQSAAEMAMCWTEIFGDDADFFSWDYGMMDTGNAWRLFHFASRGFRSGNRPAFFAMWTKSEDKYGPQLEAFHKAGFSTFHIKRDFEQLQGENIPETMGLKAEEIDALPSMLQYFKCNGAFEKNECDDGHKYSEQCPKRFGRAAWHPGFKWHALWGHSIALFVMQALISAVDDLQSYKSDSLDTLLEGLLKEEEDFYNHSFQKLDEYVKSDELRQKAMGKEMDYRNIDQLPAASFDIVHTILRGDSICHTSRIPSQIRYNGHLTMSDKVGGPSVWGQETYDTGIELEVARELNKASLQGMPLVWKNKTAERESECPFVIAPDPKDFFFIQHGYGWQPLTIPNDATRKAYHYDHTKLKGMVALILQGCDWGKCPEGFLNEEAFHDREGWEVEINGLPVTNITMIGNGAMIAHNGKTITFPPGPNGEFQLKFHVNKPQSYLRLTSAIIF